MKTGDGMLHILLCDDDAIFTETLQRLIEAQPEFNPPLYADRMRP